LEPAGWRAEVAFLRNRTRIHGRHLDFGLGLNVPNNPSLLELFHVVLSDRESASIGVADSSNTLKTMAPLDGCISLMCDLMSHR
jgi:hypothetical protein